MENLQTSDCINESKIRRDAGEAILEDLGDSIMVGGPIGEFVITPDDTEYLVRGQLRSGEPAGVLKNGKLKIEGREDTGEHYLMAHHVLHLAGKAVPFDEVCSICSAG